MSDNQAIYYATWAIQNRLVKLEELQAAAAAIPRSEYSAIARRRVGIVIPGTGSSLEHLYVKRARAFGLPEPVLQLRRFDSEGRERFVDVVHEHNGNRVLVEIDGNGHLLAEVNIEDQYRANDLVRLEEHLVRIPGLALKQDADRFLMQVWRKLGMPPR